jgi:hypothetical protein
MPGPIKPSDIVKAKQAVIPEEVYEAFNDQIAEKWSRNEAKVLQDDVVDAILAKFKAAGKPILRNAIFDRGWLDVEEVYRKAGWRVVFDKPGYNESYAAYFVFSPGTGQTRSAKTH